MSSRETVDFLATGGPHTMSVRVTERATVLALGRRDFAALLARPHPWAFSLKRRLATLVTARLRNQLCHLAGSLGDETAGTPVDDVARAFAQLEYCKPPNSRYIQRMATFNEFEPVALWGFLTAGAPARPAACTVRPALQWGGPHLPPLP